MTATVTAIGRGRKRSVYSPSYVEPLGPLLSFRTGYELHLRSAGQATKTIEKKLLALDQLAAFLGNSDVAGIGRDGMERFMVERLSKVKPSSAATTFMALRTFFTYLAVDLGEYRSPMEGMKAPGFEAPLVEVPEDRVLVAMITAAEKARPKTYEDIRDAALLRIFISGGARLSEVALLTTNDLIHMNDGRILLRVRGKGRGGGPRERHVPIGEKAAAALRRYLRVRIDHPHAANSRLWLGRKGPINPHGVREMIYRRSEAAGCRIHPHQLRHAWAVTMKKDERNRDADIMHLAGWENPKMLARYGKAVTAERAVEAFFAHGAPGDQL